MMRSSSVGNAGVLALDHIAFGVRSIAAISPAVCERLGGIPYQSGPGIGFRGAQWTLPGNGRFEAIEPDGGVEGFLHRFLAGRGNRVHHLTFKVADIHAAAAAVRAAGLSVVGLNDSLASWKEMFLHPREAQGIVVQLAEAHPEIGDDGWSDAWPYPRSAARQGRPRVVGLRMRALSAERARRQWHSLLGGRIEERENRSVFTWPGSPLRIAVEADEGCTEGPIAIEVLSSLRLQETGVAAVYGVLLMVVSAAAFLVWGGRSSL